MTPRILVTDRPDPGDRDNIAKRLTAFVEQTAGPADSRPLAVLVSDPDTGETVGGLWGRTSWGWLFVEMLFVPADLRGTGLGAELMGRAEAEARERGCRGAWLDTFSPDARRFYERLGYLPFGVLEDCPPGGRRHFLQKCWTAAT